MSLFDDTPIFTRSFVDGDLSIRGDGRTIYGLAVPFGVSAPIIDHEGRYDESFRLGAFAQTINGGALHRVKLFVKHNRSATPIGVAAELSEDAAGLIAGLRVSKTQVGDEIIELVRDGALDQLSVGFRPVHTRWSDLGNVHGRRTSPADGASAVRTEVRLDEISVVDFAAYQTANIGGVRSTSDVTPERADDEAADPTTEAESLTSWTHIQNSHDLQKRIAARLHKENQS